MKRILTTFFLLRISICIFSQSISVNGIVDFYKKIDIDCYKEKISEGMAHFNTWLRDSLPTKTEMPSWYTPTDINLQNREVIPLVALNFYNMKNFDEKESIYNHIIIDSMLSVILIVLDEERKPIGITDVAGDRYSYIDFTNKNDANAYQRWDKKVKEFLHVRRKEQPESLVYLYKLIGGLGYIKNRKLYLIPPRKKNPEELEEYIKMCLQISKEFVTGSDRIIIPETIKDFWSQDIIPIEVRLTGNTPPEKMRICF